MLPTFVVLFKQNSQAKPKIEVENDSHLCLFMLMPFRIVFKIAIAMHLPSSLCNYSLQFLIVLFILLKLAKHIFTTNQELLSELTFENYSIRGNNQPIKILHSWVALDYKRVSVQ